MGDEMNPGGDGQGDQEHEQMKTLLKRRGLNAQGSRETLKDKYDHPVYGNLSAAMTKGDINAFTVNTSGEVVRAHTKRDGSLRVADSGEVPTFRAKKATEKSPLTFYQPANLTAITAAAEAGAPASAAAAQSAVQSGAASGASAAASGAASAAASGASSVAGNTRRIAAIFGNGVFSKKGFRSLPCTKIDAEMVAKALKGIGYEIMGDHPHIDKSAAEIGEIIGDMMVVAGIAEGQGRTVHVIVYCSSHGATVDNGCAGIYGADGNIFDFKNLLDTFHNRISGPSSYLGLILDSCRVRDEKAEAGAVSIKPCRNCFIMYACNRGEVAYTGRKGKCSVFTEHLLPHLVPQLDIDIAFRKANFDMKDADQEAWMEHSLKIGGEIYF